MAECLDLLKKNFPDISDRELGELVREANKMRQKIASREDIADYDAAVLEAAQQVADQAKRKALIQKRNALYNVQAKHRLSEYLRREWSDGIDKGVEAYLLGSSVGRKGARDAVDRAQAVTVGKYLNGFDTDLDDAGQGLAEMLHRGMMDREISEALYALDMAPEKLAEMDQRAVKIANVIAKWQEVSRLEANKYGADIGKLNGYITRQSHNMDKIRAAKEQEWIAYTMERLDMEGTFGADVENAPETMRELYQRFRSGNHLKADGGTFDSKAGIGSIAKRLSQERFLKFKDGAAFHEYQIKFGNSRLSDNVLQGLKSSAEQTAIMRKLGPNARLNLSAVLDELAIETRKAGNLEQAERLASDGFRNQVDRAMDVLDGSVNIPGNVMAARANRVARQIKTMASLGGSVLSAAADPFIRASEARFQGRTYLSEYGQALGGFSKAFGQDAKARKRVAGALGLMFDDVIGSRFSPLAGDDGAPGAFSRLQERFFRWSGLVGWTNNQRVSFVLGMANDIAGQRTSKFGELNPGMQQTMRISGIAEPEWNALRKALETVDGKDLITPEAVRRLDDATIMKYSKDAGDVIPENDRALRKFMETQRDKLEDLLRGMYVDRTRIAVLEPGARTRAFTTQGTRPGTFLGEMLRHVMLFKSFSVGVMQEVVGRNLRGQSRELALSKALKDKGNPWMRNMAAFMMNGVALGYIAMSMKDIAKDRVPRDPLDPKTFLAAAAQGGGLGIYGDFLFGESNRFGGGFGATLAGPIIGGTASDIQSIYARFRDGEDAAAQALRTIYNNTPFANLFYTRWAVDSLIMNHVFEALNPGYIKRNEKRREKESGSKPLSTTLREVF